MECGLSSCHGLDGGDIMVPYQGSRYPAIVYLCQSSDFWTLAHCRDCFVKLQIKDVKMNYFLSNNSAFVNQY